MRKKSRPVPRSADKAYVKAARPFPFSIVAAMPLTISLKQHPAFVKIYFDRYLNFILILIELRLFWPKLHKKCLFLQERAKNGIAATPFTNAHELIGFYRSSIPLSPRKSDLKGNCFAPLQRGDRLPQARRKDRSVRTPLHAARPPALFGGSYKRRASLKVPTLFGAHLS